MNRTILTILFFGLISCYAQKPIEGLIDAEKNFAAYAVANGTKDAFLKFLDSSAVIFENGKAVNGIQAWMKRDRRPGILNWRPQFAEISASNDFGFTTGPWTFQQTASDTIAARGQYSTVWHKDKNGQWKVLVDLGVAGTPPNPDTLITPITKEKKGGGSLKSLLNAEQKFIDANKDSARGGYLKTINGKLFLDAPSPMIIWSRNRILPQIAGWGNSNEKDIFPENVQYSILGSGISTAGDLGYVYGTTIINGKTDNYLRIWRKENNGWRIALEVLRF
jgi:ketosteroid isomerase-like protein